jgi:hypothetical protein
MANFALDESQPTHTHFCTTPVLVARNLSTHCTHCSRPLAEAQALSRL